MNITTIPCACGCGDSLPSFDATGRPRIFLHGHYAKLRAKHPDATPIHHSAILWGTTRLLRILRTCDRRGVLEHVLADLLPVHIVPEVLTALRNRFRSTSEPSLTE